MPRRGRHRGRAWRARWSAARCCSGSTRSPPRRASRCSQVEDLRVRRRSRPGGRPRPLADVRAGEIVGIAGRRRQRAERAGRGDRRAAPARAAARSASTAATSRGDARAMLDAGRRAHPGGPPPPRPGARLLAGRERRAARLRRAARTRASAGCRRAACWSAPAGSSSEFDVRGGTPATPARSLSGGNQQKLVLAREIESRPAPAARGAADARPRRRRDRVRAPPPGRAARRRPRDPARLVRARRDPRRSPTASSSCTRAGSSASSSPTPTRRSSASP